MQIIIYERYGGPEVLQLTERPLPQPAPGEVRVRVHASSINAADVRLMRADPFLVRLANGLLAPKKQTLGADLAGVVEALGPGARTLQIGDAVFGHTSLGGGLAEAACVPEDALAPIPEGLDDHQAASLVLAGFTALQAVRERARVEPGQSVLIHGAGGGVGTLLVQIAKAYGAQVTAVCGPASVELVESLGADRALDYTRHDFTTDEARHDAVFGVNGHRPLTAYRDALRPGGLYLMIGGHSRQLFEAMLLGRLRFAGSGRRIELLRLDHDRHPDDLSELRRLVAAGSLRPVIDRVVPLEQTADAMRYVERGHVLGKVAVQIAA
ncbi:MAG: NAD(P)-dependent alcohol dehydrogenase [Acidobacteriota bacterium]